MLLSIAASAVALANSVSSSVLVRDDCHARNDCDPRDYCNANTIPTQIRIAYAGSNGMAVYQTRCLVWCRQNHSSLCRIWYFNHLSDLNDLQQSCCDYGSAARYHIQLPACLWKCGIQLHNCSRNWQRNSFSICHDWRYGYHGPWWIKHHGRCRCCESSDGWRKDDHRFSVIIQVRIWFRMACRWYRIRWCLVRNSNVSFWKITSWSGLGLRKRRADISLHTTRPIMVLSMTKYWTSSSNETVVISSVRPYMVVPGILSYHYYLYYPDIFQGITMRIVTMGQT